jgi:signal peptidase I
VVKKQRKRERVYGRGGVKTEPNGPAKPPGDGSLWEGVKSLGLALVLFLVLRSFVIQNFVITSGSMEETLLVGDFLMVNRVALGRRIPFTTVSIPGYSEPRRFDVIVFEPSHVADLKLVKRLIGMPGDTLSMTERVLSINGEVVDEPWVSHEDVPDEGATVPYMEWQRDHLVLGVDRATYRPTRDNWGPLVIPEGRYFMLGDNRETSLDSRYWGLLERWRLEGKAVFIYFSYNRDSVRPFAFLREIRWRRFGQGID